MSSVKTTVKTELCSFTEYRIYPGHGIKFVAKDGKLSTFIKQKAISLFHQKKKPAKLRWTLVWRRLHKKGKTEERHKRRSRKTAKIQKAIVGLTLEDLKRKRAQKPELRQAAREAAVEEAKKRKMKKDAAAKSATARFGQGSKGATQMSQLQPKLQQSIKQKQSAQGSRKK